MKYYSFLQPTTTLMKKSRLKIKHTFPDFTFSAHRGPYCGMPRAISNQARTVGARHLSIGIDAASLSNRNFSAYPSSVSGDQLRPYTSQAPSVK